MNKLDCFREIVLMDFEFTSPPGERPTPICLVAKELRSGRVIRLWQDQLASLSSPPFPTGPDTLLVAYYISAELNCFLALNWPMPERMLDLCAEFRWLTSGLSHSRIPGQHKLLGALMYHGLDGIAAAEKEAMQRLAMRGGPYTDAERQDLLAYCQTDVDALAKLLPAMLPKIDLPRALIRARYMASVAKIEFRGVPIDVPTLASLQRNWDFTRDCLIARVDADYGVYEGHTFKAARFATYLARHEIAWPCLESGALDLKDETFKFMAEVHPQLLQLKELRATLSKLKLNDLAVGKDGRNRCLLGAFGSKTGRNQPSNAQYVFGPAVWIRGLIKPPPGWAVAYVDYEQQEFAIAAYLSKDPRMIQAYESGDAYLAFAQQAGAAPAGATKKSHGAVREVFKNCALGVQYGMGVASLANRHGWSTAMGRDLVGLHRTIYERYWAWSDNALDYAMLNGQLHAAFGWRVLTGSNPNPRSLRNFPLQANGAEMLRLACCLATERGIRVCGPVHDAVLIEAPIDCIEAEVSRCQLAMQEASILVLDGFPLRTEVKVVSHPHRYADPRGQAMWDLVMQLIAERATGAVENMTELCGHPILG